MLEGILHRDWKLLLLFPQKDRLEDYFRCPLPVPVSFACFLSLLPVQLSFPVDKAFLALSSETQTNFGE